MDVVDYHRTYKLNSTSTQKCLLLRHGNAQKSFLMDVVSNGDFIEAEFSRWIATMKHEKQRLVSSREIGLALQRLNNAHTRVFTNVC